MEGTRQASIRSTRVSALIIAGWVVVLAPNAYTTSGAAAVAWLVVSAGPLLFRHRRPVLVFVAVLVLGVLTHLLVPGPHVFPVALVLVAVHSVALHERGRRLLAPVSATAAGLVLVVVLVLAGSTTDEGETVPLWGALALGTTLLAAVVLLGANTRGRQEQVSALEERALRLEVEREQSTRIAVTAERSRIAGEMHDIVSHSIAVMVSLSDGLAARASATSWAPSDPEALRAVSTTGRQALDEMRRLLGLLGDDPSDAGGRRAPLPGTDDLDALLHQVRAAGLPVVLVREGELPALSAGAGLAVYRIIQESLTNALKHAGPGVRTTVLLRARGSRLEVEVTDDGGSRHRGPEQPPAVGGHGLPGMGERVASYGGTFEAGPRDPSGWRVRAVLQTAQPAGAAGVPLEAVVR